MTAADSAAVGGLLDLVCFGYLADTQVLQVNAFPGPDDGAVIEAAAATIAGDAALAAVTAARLGRPTGLITNTIGVDPAGHRLLDWLDQARVHHTVAAVPGTATPQLTVIADNTTRTWFAQLQHAYADLLHAGLGLLNHARLVYVDSHPVIADAAARCVTQAPAPLLLNLGGHPPTDTITAAAGGRRVLAVQTSCAPAAIETAGDLADELFDQFGPDAAIVTLGPAGAIARTRRGRHRAVPAVTVTAPVHGAGAAFAAGYADAVLGGADTEAALTAGCRVATAYCASPAAAVPRRLPAASFASS